MTAFEIRLALGLVTGIARQQGRVYGQKLHAWARVHGFRLQVRIRRGLVRYFKKRKVARTRRLVLQGSFWTLVLVVALQPSDSVMAVAAVGITGIVAARLAPGKVIKADTRKLASKMYGNQGP